jgi:hypothetical protein
MKIKYKFSEGGFEKMFLFEYIIKLLISNSDTVFMGLIIVVFGYYGWLIWNINDRIKKIKNKLEKNEEIIINIMDNSEFLKTKVDKDILNSFNENLHLLKIINTGMDDLNDYQDNIKRDIITEIKESSEETKEIIKLILSRYRFNNNNNNTKDK